ncbi:MAG: flavodoxin-dependent (E)-4-hydroxy-3-methylbut-2-enyl-diphosphate synthase [Candidatus Omnitrophica bacterium]|nr:flavodoxin-dependent (E)-4-hydroxy-3-methylbut-2-enyl-diphosphate synthase [Candidatus Omnitrophota bacterium]
MTKIVKIGNLKIGGSNPVRIKGMLKTLTKDTKNLIKEARTLESEGAEAIRVAVKEKKDAKLAKLLKKHISIPLVADIHFNSSLGLLAIKEGFPGIRLNPLNIYHKKDVSKIAAMAREYGVSVRIGVNSGGFKKDFFSPQDLAEEMVKKVEDYLKILEAEKLFDIMVSMKGSDVISTIVANRIFSKRHDYPLHLGITASGPFLEGITKSSVGLGSLLNSGIGSIIRVSLTAPSYLEVRVAKHILEALNLRRFGPEIISCPTCSRCEANLIKIVDSFKKRLQASGFKKNLRIAIMGCVVNGPGEAYQADIGAAFGKKKAVIFKKDKILKISDENKIITDLLREVKKYGFEQN